MISLSLKKPWIKQRQQARKILSRRKGPVENADSESTEGKEISTVSAGVPSLTELMAQPSGSQGSAGDLSAFSRCYFLSASTCG
jgi:hypothetical protein